MSSESGRKDVMKIRHLHHELKKKKKRKKREKTLWPFTVKYDRNMQMIALREWRLTLKL